MIPSIARFIAVTVLCGPSPEVSPVCLQTVVRDLGSEDGPTSSKARLTLQRLAQRNEFKTDEQCQMVISGLTELLKSGDTNQRGDVAIIFQLILRKRPNALKSAVPALIQSLDQERFNGTQCEIISTLGAIGPDAAAVVPQLKKLCVDGEEFQKTRAAAALAAIVPNDNEGVILLAGWLRSGSPMLRWCSAFWLGTIGIRANSAVTVLRQALHDENCVVRVLAARSLWQITSSPEVLPVLLAALSEEDESVFTKPFYSGNWLPSHRMSAISALGLMGPQAEVAIPALDKIMKQKDATLRLAAASALGKIGKASTSVLQRALQDKVPDVRSAAEAALKEIDKANSPKSKAGAK